MSYNNQLTTVQGEMVQIAVCVKSVCAEWVYLADIIQLVLQGLPDDIIY